MAANSEITVTRQRIFDAAVRLFARRGFEAVGIRDIARAAGANIAGVNYHYGGKVGLLKAILEKYIHAYWSALGAVAEKQLPVREHILGTVQVLIRFYRENTELAIAAENSGTERIPEVSSLVARLRAGYREYNNEYFAGLGLDLSDPAAMTLMRGLLTVVVANHIHARYEHEVVVGQPQGLTREEKARLPELRTKYDDRFYEQFARKFADFYLAGVEAIRPRGSKRAKWRKPSEVAAARGKKVK
jgi:AcrR family transcriptional regulator